MLSKTAEYALRAVALLASKSGQPLAAELLAEKTKIPRRYLQRVLQDLVGANLLTSRPGPGGGYEVTRPAREVSILQVVNAVSPLERIRHCPLGLKTHTTLCPLHAELDKAYAATEKAFAGVSMQDILDSTDHVIPLCESEKFSERNATIAPESAT
jgi:Rrf2 family nitric oxide-sensitive transcriptional repressor